ncbi:hypothetical protein [Melghirimyces algeriensis]|nr:hypothetical protein [Melghirimyces algeriensis]
MKKWWIRIGGSYMLCIMIFVAGYLWIIDRYHIFSGPVDPVGLEWFWCWIMGFGLLFSVPVGVLTVAAGVLTYRCHTDHPRRGLSILIGLLLTFPAICAVLFTFLVFIAVFQG